MDASNIQNGVCKILKIWCQTCLFCCKKYPISICVMLLFFLSYTFVPSVFTFLIYSSPLVGFSILVHRVFLAIDCRQVKKTEEDNRKKKFVKSRRSFKSNYGDRQRIVPRNAIEKSKDETHMDLGDKDAVFSKSFNDDLFDKSSWIEEYPKEIREVNIESVVDRAKCSSSKDSQSLKPETYDRSEGESLDVSDDEDDEPQDRAVQWTEDDQKNVMDLGILETERNKRLESLIQRRRSRKFLSFQDRRMTGNNNHNNNNNGEISAIQIPKANPFLVEGSNNMNTPGSAPSSFLTRSPFDIPYDPHEEKPNLSGDSFLEEFTVGHQKEPVFCRHESFSLGHEITHDKHEMSFYKPRNFTRFRTSTLDNEGDDKHIQQDSPISDYSINSNHPKEDGIEMKMKTKTKAILEVHHHASNSEGSYFERNYDSYDCGPSPIDDRKADIYFFYGPNKRVCHGPSSSIVSDLQVEVSDEDEASLNDKEIVLNSSNLYEDYVNDPEIFDNNSQENLKTVVDLNTRQDDTNSRVLEVETLGLIHTLPSMEHDDVANEQVAVPDRLTELAVEQAPVTLNSPKSVLQTEILPSDQPSSSNMGDGLVNTRTIVKDSENMSNA